MSRLKLTTFRSFLKTHFSPAQEPDSSVTVARLRMGCIESRWTARRENHPFIHNGPSICLEDSEIGRIFGSINSTPRVARTFGLQCLTGTIQFGTEELRDRDYRSSGPDCACTCPDGNLALNMWVRLALPRWLSYRVLEIIAQKARIGWKQYIRVRNVFPSLGAECRTPFFEACKNIAYGQLQSLKAMVDKREVTPWDEDGRGETMWAVSSTHRY